MEAIQRSAQAGFLRPIRNVCLAAARRWPWPVRVKLCNNRHAYVDLRSRVGRALFMKGEFDREVFAPMRGVLKEGGTFLDVGANAGFYSLLALDLVGPTGAVHAFDVDGRALRCLRKTVQREALRNLHVHAVGISNTDGFARLDLISDCGRTRIQSSGTGPMVPTMTLDTWRLKFPVRNVQAIKMDIEGGELAALQGAARLLSEERPLLVCELLESHTRHAGYKKAEVVQLLQSLGYRVEWHEGVWYDGIIATWTAAR
jgi:FkbM family methyltransferase